MTCMPSAMHAPRRHVKLTAWVGLLAMCLQLWASGLSHQHMLEKQLRTVLYGAICSSHGGSSSAPDSPLSSHTSQSHCAICALSGAMPLASSHDLAYLRLPQARQSRSFQQAQAEPHSPDQRHAPPRAPPSLS